MLDHALAAHAAGLAVVPPLQNGTKAPLAAWKDYQSTRPDEEQLRRWYSNGRTGIGFVCGAVSGGLEMLELEGRAVDTGLDDRFVEACEAAGLAELLDRLFDGYWERSPSGGYHWLYRCEVTGSEKLAFDANGKVTIETKGEGGYTIAAPSHGKVHKDGGAWELLKGTFATIPTFTVDERAALHAVARSIDQRPAVLAPASTNGQQHGRRSATPSSGWVDAVIADYNARTTWAEVLAGEFEWLSDLGAESHWHYVGADNAMSATTNHTGNDTLIVFSGSAEGAGWHIWDGRDKAPSYDRFSARVLLDTGRHDQAARLEVARRLRDGGYGPPPEPRIEPSDLAELPEQPDAEGIAQKLDARLTRLPDDFWTARPWLTHVRDAAWSRNRSPDFVLAAGLARLAAYSDHRLELPAIVGSPGSLNIAVAGIGGPGAGKSTCSDIAGELIEKPVGLDVADNMPLGSGEGLAELYMGTVEEDGEKGKKIKTRKQVRHNAFVYGDEGQALTALTQRQGATLPEAIRRAWSGADLGQANANADRTRVIHGPTYRLGLVVGFQPKHAGDLLADADSGTPQRFLWISAHAQLPDHPPAWPGSLKLPRLSPSTTASHETTARGYTRIRFDVDPAIATEIRANDRARVQGEMTIDILDAHEPLHRLKLAALFALADSRLDITLEDWALADVMWATSCRVRSTVVAAVRAHAARTEAARTEQYARRELAAEASRQSAGTTIERYAARLARWLHDKHDAGQQPDDGWPKHALRARFNTSERTLFAQVLNHAITKDLIAELADTNPTRYTAGKARPA